MPDAHEAVVGHALAHAFYDVVPEQYRTYCPLVSRIGAAVFSHFDVPANLVSCQLWLDGPNTNHVIGFTGKGDFQDRWDGHVVCMTEKLLFDAAVSTLRRDFGLDVPAAVLLPRVDAHSQVLARGDLDSERRLWWFGAPYGFDTTPPLQPVETIRHYTQELVLRLERELGPPPSRRDAA